MVGSGGCVLGHSVGGARIDGDRPLDGTGVAADLGAPVVEDGVDLGELVG